MIITDLKRLGKGRYEVALDGEAAFVLYKGDLARYDLHVGEVLTEECRTQIYGETLRKRAVNHILFLLQSRDYTRYELKEKLRKGQYPDEIMESALAEVAGYGYINDANYAERYVECYRERKSLGKIKQELLRRGIDRETVEEAIEEGRRVQEEAGEHPEQMQIRRLLEKRHFDPGAADRKEKEKHYAFLMRRGYSSSDILAVFREYKDGQILDEYNLT